MKLLYLVPSINNEGGVARVLSSKTNYLVEKLAYEVHIVTQNKGNLPLFYSFNPKIIMHDIILKGNKMKFLLDYKNKLKKICQEINPDIIIVSDNGLKGYFVPLLLGTKTPIIFEIHGSKNIEEQEQSSLFFSKTISLLKLLLKEFGAKKFTRFIALSKHSLKEWSVNNGLIITNPLVLNNEVKANLQSKKVIAVARHSYEKGLDRLLNIWQKVVEKHPDWILEIYGRKSQDLDLKKIASNLQITDSVYFYDPVKNIEDKYASASILVMTSRTEGFGMVLIEAMACGLPCIAYDCPVGPGSVITNNVDGYLIENGNEKQFVEKLSELIENKDLRIKLGEKGQKSVRRFDIETIMSHWNELFVSLKKD